MKLTDETRVAVRICCRHGVANVTVGKTTLQLSLGQLNVLSSTINSALDSFRRGEAKSSSDGALDTAN